MNLRTELFVSAPIEKTYQNTNINRFIPFYNIHQVNYYNHIDIQKGVNMNNLYILVQAIIWKSDKPMSGYDIAMVVKGKTGNSHQQVYRELKKLATRSDVIVDVIPQDGKPDKKVYSFKSKEGFVTESGFVSDFSKTSVGYELLIRDVLDDTNNYDEYIKAMKECELKFLGELNKAD